MRVGGDFDDERFQMLDHDTPRIDNSCVWLHGRVPEGHTGAECPKGTLAVSFSLVSSLNIACRGRLAMNQPIGRRVLPMVTGCIVLIPLGLVPARAEDWSAPQRPTLGISVADVSDLTRRRYGVGVASGAVISQIREGSPAALAGLPLGGVIVSINGKRIGSAKDLVELMQVFRPGEQVEVTYFEGDRIGRKTIRLVGVPAVTAVPPPAGGHAGWARGPPTAIGTPRRWRSTDPGLAGADVGPHHAACRRVRRTGSTAGARFPARRSAPDRVRITTPTRASTRPATRRTMNRPSRSRMNSLNCAANWNRSSGNWRRCDAESNNSNASEQPDHNRNA